ncbi:hypothetical protein [Nocardia spumae]|uniref:hypothetical protein n=1 Tax=Nocardia spumae TaxID=2887190 RepID=UPI001D156693|nr:hypothetical protein [Nocardia spumae]
MNRQRRYAGSAPTAAGPAAHPARGDVHLRIWLNGTAFDYRAAAGAIHNLIRDWQRKRWCAIEIVEHTIEDMLPETRLPNERLFIGP